MTDKLADAILGGRDVLPQSLFRSAVVSSASPLEITVGGQSGIPASRLASYTATLSDLVRVEETEAGYLIHGKIA